MPGFAIILGNSPCHKPEITGLIFSHAAYIVVDQSIGSRIFLISTGIHIPSHDTPLGNCPEVISFNKYLYNSIAIGIISPIRFVIYRISSRNRIILAALQIRNNYHRHAEQKKHLKEFNTTQFYRYSLHFFLPIGC